MAHGLATTVLRLFAEGHGVWEYSFVIEIVFFAFAPQMLNRTRQLQVRRMSGRPDASSSAAQPRVRTDTTWRRGTQKAAYNAEAVRHINHHCTTCGANNLPQLKAKAAVLSQEDCAISEMRKYVNISS
jgi:hypothetical protein